MPQASQVSIFKNEQLIFSDYLNAGYRRVNTQGFPDGGYELTIKIGANTIQRRFFNKGLFLPPLHAPQFYIMGGVLTNGMILNNNAYNFLPKILGIPVLEAGLNQRVNEKMAVFSDVIASSQESLIDIGPTVFLSNAFVKTAALLTTKNNYGFYTQLNTQKNRLTLNLIATKIFYAHKLKNQCNLPKTNYAFLSSLVDNDSASISYGFSENDLLGIQANYNNNWIQSPNYTLGAFYQRQIGHYDGMNIF